jgi:PAS domain S-box-containing protein
MTNSFGLADDGASSELASVLREIIDKVEATVWAAAGPDHNFEIRAWNRGAERLYGFSAIEAIGKNYLDLFVNPLEREQARIDHVEIVENQRTYRNLATDIMSDGTERRMLTMGFPVRDPTDGADLLGELGVDVTDLANADEQHLQRMRESAIRQEEKRALGNLLTYLTELNLRLARPEAQRDEAALLNVGLDVMQRFLGSTVESAIWVGRVADGAEPMFVTDHWVTPASVNLSRVLADCERGLMSPHVISEGSIVRRAAVLNYVHKSHRLGHPLAIIPLSHQSGTLALQILFTPNLRELSAPVTEILPVLSMVILGHARLVYEVRRRQNQADRLRDETIRLALNGDFAHTIRKDVAPMTSNLVTLRAILHSAGLPERGEAFDILRDLEKSCTRLSEAPDKLRKASVRGPVDILEVLSWVPNDLDIKLRPDAEVSVAIMKGDLKGPTWVFGAVGELQTVFADLAYNAIEAMAEHGNLLIAVAEETGFVSITFHDNGPGVPSGMEDTIFLQGVSTKGEDHGYGLHRARQICLGLGGDIVLIPTDCGACFRVTVPLFGKDGNGEDFTTGR